MASENIERLGIEAKANVESAISKLNKLSKSIESLDTTASNVDTSSVKTATDQMGKYYDQLQVKVDKARANIQKSLSQNLSQMTDSQIARAQVDARNKLASAQNRLLSAKEGSQGQTSFAIQVAEARQQLKMLDNEMASRGQKGLQVKGGEEAINKIKKFGSALRTGMAKLNSFATKVDALGTKIVRFGKRVLSAVNPLNHLRNEQNKLSLSSTLLGKAFLKVARMFRIMVTRMLIRGFISNIREGFQNIAQYSDVVNQKFSAIISSAKTLYNAFASAFTPLIEAIAPYVVRALDFITSAMNRVAEFLSALTGKSYFIKATKYQTDYAKSLDKTGKSAGKTAKKVKELKSATIGIDKLNVIEKKQPDTSNSGSGNGAGGGGASANDMFDTKPVSKKMKDLAKEVKKIAKKLFNPIQEAWNKKGAKVLGSFKTMLGSIWETIKDIGRDFLTMWAQPQTEIIFEDILDTVATIFDIVTAISDQFRKAWNKDNVGLHIFENIRDVFGIIVSRIKRIALYTKLWARNLNFTPMLKSIEKYTRSLKKLVAGLSDIASDFYKTVVLGISKWVVEKGLPALVDVFTDFNNQVDWQSLRKSLKVVWEGVKKFGEAVGQGLIDFIRWLSQGIKDLLNSRWFKGFLEAIGNALKLIKPQLVTGALKTFFKVWLGFKAIKFVTGLLYSIAGGIAKIRGVIKTVQDSKFLTGLVKFTPWLATIYALTKYNELKNRADGISKIAEQTDKITTSFDNYKSAINNSKEDREELNDYYSTQSGELDILYNKLEELNGIEDKNSSQKQEMKDIVDELNSKIPDLGLKYDSVKDKLNKYTGEIYNNISAMRQQLEEEALAESRKQIIEDMAKANRELAKQNKLLAENKSNIETVFFNWNETMAGKNQADVQRIQNQIDATRNLFDAYKSGAMSLSDLRIQAESIGLTQNKYFNQIYKYYDQQEKIRGNIKKSKKDVNDLNAEYNETYNTLSKIKQLKAFNSLVSQAQKTGLKVSARFIKGVEKGKYIIPKTINQLQRMVSFDKLLKKADLTGKDIPKRLQKAIANGKVDAKDVVKYEELLKKAKEKSPQIAEEISKGIKGNKKSVQNAISELQKVIDGTKGKTVNINANTNPAENTVNGWKPKDKKLDVNAKINYGKKHTITINGKLKKIQVPAKIFIPFVAKNVNKKSAEKWKSGDYFGRKTWLDFRANGGFPKLGSQFIAGEKGAEFVGTINGKTGVASNQEITGIRDSIVETSNAQIQMLNEQNNLLRGILEKNTDIVLDGQKVTKRVNQINDRRGYKMAT